MKNRPTHDDAGLRADDIEQHVSRRKFLARAATISAAGVAAAGVTAARVQEWIDALRKARKSVDAKIYPGARHGFFNNTRPEAYNAAAAADAWQRTLKFFADRLGK